MLAALETLDKRRFIAKKLGDVGVNRPSHGLVEIA